MLQNKLLSIYFKGPRIKKKKKKSAEPKTSWPSATHVPCCKTRFVLHFPWCSWIVWMDLSFRPTRCLSHRRFVTYLKPRAQTETTLIDRHQVKAVADKQTIKWENTCSLQKTSYSKRLCVKWPFKHWTSNTTNGVLRDSDFNIIVTNIWQLGCFENAM